MKREEIIALLDLFESNDWQVMQLRRGDFQIALSRNPNCRIEITGPEVDIEAQAGAPAAGGAEDHTPIETHIVRAPSLGTFCRPGSGAGLEIGQSVEAGAEVGGLKILENVASLQSGCAGTIHEIFVADGELVEFDQALIAVKVEGQ